MKKVGNYLLLKVLGEGQFGTVYKASHTGNPDDYYAIKTIAKSKIQGNAKLMKLFDTEMAVMSKIKHPNIMHLYEYMETQNNYYLVIQYCNNGDLEGHLKKHKKLSQDESLYFLMQIMNGFRELHKYKIMHRDFKLANIFLNEDSIVIGDFGFAKSGSDMATTKLGTPLTMAPELLNAGSNLNYTNKADLWSIGVCFYQMICGCPPFKVSSMGELQQKVKTQSGDNLSFPVDVKLSPECKSLLQKLMQADPKKRIDWNEFFTHPVFSLGKTSNAGDQQSMTQSIMFHNNKDKVQMQFAGNAQEKMDEVE
jgi:serine/threonine-protein kinase ULK/ATG1